MRQVVIDRRTFLKAAGLSAVGVGAAGSALASRDEHALTDRPPTQFAGDPITSQAATLGFDRDRIHRFVADEIAYEPDVEEARRLGRVDGQRVCIASARTSIVPVMVMPGAMGGSVGSGDAWAATALNRMAVRSRALRSRALTRVAAARTRRPTAIRCRDPLSVNQPADIFFVSRSRRSRR